MPISVLNKTATFIKYNNFHEVSKFSVPSSQNATLRGPVSVLDGGTGHAINYFFIILYYDQQMHNHFTNYHTATCFDTIVSSSGSL